LFAIGTEVEAASWAAVDASAWFTLEAVGCGSTR
jgi:hypothetical protein